MVRTSLVALMLLALVSIAGCVSGHGSGSTSPSTPDRPAPTSHAPSVSEGEAGRLPQFPSPTTPPSLPSPKAATKDFVAAVFRDVQASWQSAFDAAGLRYVPARMALFSSTVSTGCGTESSEVGPFYCPADHTVYLDIAFFDQMEHRYGVKGDFAMAYVVAHEVGHHIQAIVGLSAQVAAIQAAQPSLANTLSVLTELQADCYAGIWAHTTYRRNLLEPGDMQEALSAAAAVGDDFQQHTATGTIQPESWTHGSSAQRQHWLSIGFDSGKPASCDTFAALNH